MDNKIKHSLVISVTLCCCKHYQFIGWLSAHFSLAFYCHCVICHFFSLYSRLSIVLTGFVINLCSQVLVWMENNWKLRVMCYWHLLKICSMLSLWMPYTRYSVVSVSLFLAIFHYVINCFLFLAQVLSAFGVVQKIAMFEKNEGLQALIQYPGECQFLCFISI